VTGSLATILWLAVLRRERIKVSSLQFLKLGIIVMSVALIAAIGSLFIV
jgi:arsenical pump membrane protein